MAKEMSIRCDNCQSECKPFRKEETPIFLHHFTLTQFIEDRDSGSEFGVSMLNEYHFCTASCLHKFVSRLVST